jgi:hypothetical protein
MTFDAVNRWRVIHLPITLANVRAEHEDEGIRIFEHCVECTVIREPIRKSTDGRRAKAGATSSHGGPGG